MTTFEIALLAVFAFLVFLRVAVVVIVAYAVVRPVRSCPACFMPTLPVRVRWWLLLPLAFEWRWCPDCGWEGPSRREPRRPRSVPSRRGQIRRASEAERRPPRDLG